jgi:phage terminase large subunit-like protein
MIQKVVDLGFRPRNWSVDVFRSLIRFSILVIHRGAGKTYLAIMKLVDEALRRPQGMSLFGYVAPELKQSKGIAWEILKMYALKVPGTDSNESELWVQFSNGARIQLFGADHYDSIRGRHFSGIVIDEVAQMRREVWVEVILPALANRNGWALFIGTPKGINLFSELYHQAIADPSWFQKKLTCYDTDVYTPEQIEELRSKMGERAFRQEMLCDFMASTDNTLISLDTAIAASTRFIEERFRSFAPIILGVDVAHEGGDRCVIFPRQGLQAFQYEATPGLPEKQYWNVVATAIKKWKADACWVDTTGGYGTEVVSRLQDAGFMAQGVVFSEGKEHGVAERFQNRRAEMWFKMADWLKEGSIPKGADLQSELCAPTYSNDSASMRLQLESKRKIKERIGVSPDIADALAITFAYNAPQRMVDSQIAPQYAGELMSSTSREPIQAKLDYNPYRKR